MSDNSLRYHPTALLVGVTSGKGGVGKSTTAAVLATAFAARGHKTVVVDLDVSAPNAHIVGRLDTVEVKADRAALTAELPLSPYGYYVASPKSMPGGSGRVGDVLALGKHVDAVDVFVFDLPGGWTDAHDDFMECFPHTAVTVASPTVEAAHDHERVIRGFASGYKSAHDKLASRDKRRNWSKLMPAAPALFGYETMARFTGVDEKSGKTVTIRRSDVEDDTFVASLMERTGVSYAGSLPGGAVDEVALTSPAAGLAEELEGLLSDDDA